MTTTATASVQICWERLTHYTATVDTAKMRELIDAEGWDENNDQAARALLDRIDAGEPFTFAEVNSTLSGYCGAALFADLEDEDTTEQDTKALELCQVAAPGGNVRRLTAQAH